MLALAKNLDQMKTTPNSNIFMSALDIPVFHLVAQKELTCFKLYTWNQSVYDYEGSLDDFMKNMDKPELANCFRNIRSSYEQISSAEIWTENTIMSTLNLIRYYAEIGCFSNQELPLLLCEQVINILDKLQMWTEKGQKGKSSSTPFKFYVSEMELENTYILMKREGVINCLLKLFTINSLNIFDNDFCRETESWLRKLSERSVMLCGNSEKNRIKFFNDQRQKVQFLMKKIKTLF
jgi:hypothetical protein